MLKVETVAPYLSCGTGKQVKYVGEAMSGRRVCQA